MKKLRELLRPVKRKVLFEKWCRWFFLCSTALGIVTILLFIVDKWFPVPLLHTAIGCFLLLSIMLPCFILLVFDKTGYEDAAKAVDRLGYQERFITAYEILNRGEKTAAERLAVEDAIAVGKQEQPGKQYHIYFEKKLLACLLIICIAAGITGFLPVKRMEADKIIEKEYIEIVEVQKEMKKNPDIPEADMKELNSQLKTFSNAIKKAQSTKEAQKAIEKTQNGLKKLEKDSVNEALQELSKALSQNKNTAGLSNALEMGNEQQISQEMQKLLDSIGNMTQEELSALGEAMKAMAEQLSDEEMAALLEQLSKDLSNGGSPQISAQQLQEMLSRLAQQGAEFRQGLEKMNGQLSIASGTLQSQNSQSNQNENQTGQQGEQGNQEGQNGAGQGSGQGQGNGAGQGSGQGQGNGIGQGSGQGQGRGTGHEETEKVYTREGEGLQGYDTKIDGAENEGGSVQITERKTIGEAGESVGYDQVIRQYQEEALSQLEAMEIPYGMKDIVEEYFSTLEQ